MRGGMPQSPASMTSSAFAARLRFSSFSSAAGVCGLSESKADGVQAPAGVLGHIGVAP